MQKIISTPNGQVSVTVNSAEELLNCVLNYQFQEEFDKLVENDFGWDNVPACIISMYNYGYMSAFDVWKRMTEKQFEK